MEQIFNCFMGKTPFRYLFGQNSALFFCVKTLFYSDKTPSYMFIYSHLYLRLVLFPCSYTVQIFRGSHPVCEEPQTVNEHRMMMNHESFTFSFLLTFAERRFEYDEVLGKTSSFFSQSPHANVPANVNAIGSGSRRSYTHGECEA